MSGEVFLIIYTLVSLHAHNDHSAISGFSAFLHISISASVRIFLESANPGSFPYSPVSSNPPHRFRRRAKYSSSIFTSLSIICVAYSFCARSSLPWAGCGVKAPSEQKIFRPRREWCCNFPACPPADTGILLCSSSHF